MKKRSNNRNSLVARDFSNLEDTKSVEEHTIVNTMIPVKGQITFIDGIVPIEYGADVTSQLPQVDINFPFLFYYKAKTMEAIEDYQSITIRSATKVDLCGKSYYESNNEPNVYLPKLHKRWCCFAKDTMIKKSDNSIVAVSDLILGDELISKIGKTVKIKDIIKGKENSIHTITTKSGKSIKVTSGHPLLTSEGTVNSSEIRPAMKLLCEDGTDTVYCVYIESYRDMTYNIVTENGSDWLLANGIWAGNYDCQNENMVSNQTVKKFSREDTELRGKFKDLIGEIHGK